MRTTVDIEACVMIATAMAATIGNIYAWTAVVEVAGSVMTIDGEGPATCTPDNGTEEIVGSRQKAVLPIMEDAAQVVQAVAVVAAIDVGR